MHMTCGITSSFESENKNDHSVDCLSRTFTLVVMVLMSSMYFNTKFIIPRYVFTSQSVYQKRL